MAREAKGTDFTLTYGQWGDPLHRGPLTELRRWHLVKKVSETFQQVTYKVLLDEHI